MSQVENYLYLRSRLVDISCPENKLDILKEYFRSEIFSDRRYDRIKNLMNLITILEKRDVISPNDIDPLYYIANVLKHYDIMEIINRFNVPVQAEPGRRNVEALVELRNQNVAALVEPRNQNVTASNNNIRVLPVTDTDPIRKIYNYICREIGQKWKDFARALNISEGYIDQLETTHRNNIEEMAREVIIYHKENCDPRYWQCKLIQALDAARRKDLSIKVQEMFAMHSFE